MRTREWLPCVQDLYKLCMATKSYTIPFLQENLPQRNVEAKKEQHIKDMLGAHN